MTFPPAENGPTPARPRDPAWQTFEERIRQRTRQRLLSERDEAARRGDTATAEALTVELERLDDPAAARGAGEATFPSPAHGPTRSQKLGGAVAAGLALLLSLFSWWAGGREARRANEPGAAEAAPLVAIGRPYSELLPGVTPSSPTAPPRPALSEPPRTGTRADRVVPAVNRTRAGGGESAEETGAGGPAASGPSSTSPETPAPERAADGSRSRAPAERRIRETLQRYGAAYNALDAAAAQRVWPSVDAGDLARAFQGLSSQEVTFDRCQIIELRATRARATCVGEATYVLSSGPRDPRRERRRWTFDLARDGEDWTITGVDVRR